MAEKNYQAKLNIKYSQKTGGMAVIEVKNQNYPISDPFEFIIPINQNAQALYNQALLNGEPYTQLKGLRRNRDRILNMFIKETKNIVTNSLEGAVNELNEVRTLNIKSHNGTCLNLNETSRKYGRKTTLQRRNSKILP